MRCCTPPGRAPDQAQAPLHQGQWESKLVPSCQHRLWLDAFSTSSSSAQLQSWKGTGTQGDGCAETPSMAAKLLQRVQPH